MNTISIFEKAKAKNRLSHLYLLTGNNDVDKLSLAHLISHLILKDYDKRENLLDLITQSNYSQVLHIKAEGNVIKKSQILELQKTFSKTSLIDAPRIYIIEDIDLISLEAANSLLKFMEEPENSLIFGILTTSNQGNVLATIISRAQVIRVFEETKNEVFKKLIELEISPYLAKQISYLTKDLTKALELLKDENFNLIVTFLYSYFTSYNERSNLDVNKVSDLIFDRSLYQTLIELMIFNYNEVLKSNLKEETSLIEIINTETKKLKKDYLINKINILQDELIKQNAYINTSLSFDALIIKLLKEE